MRRRHPDEEATPGTEAPVATGTPTSARSLRICGLTLVELLLSLAIVGILIATAVASYGYLREKQDVIQAVIDIQEIESLLEHFYVANTRYPDSLAEIAAAAAMRDPWGNPYQYLNIMTTNNHGKVRKDHALVPLNTDYDLYSMGEDGRSVSPLTAQASHDDIVRANNGGFVGLATDY